MMEKTTAFHEWSNYILENASTFEVGSSVLTCLMIGGVVATGSLSIYLHHITQTKGVN